ncbi:MAG TPA: hypothetical protein VG432_16110 [Gemmatimonadaceae bacterium]|nr:hypothetical protein [Gemmatimonadaceae bacterium]
MRPHLALRFITLAATACGAPLPVAELRSAVVEDLPSALAEIATPPPNGAWHCVPNASRYRCGGGPRDSLTVQIDSIIANRRAAEAQVQLEASGRLESHFGPGAVEGFWVRWVDTYHWSGTKWERSGRRIDLIT